MSELEEIEQRIRKLPPDELARFRAWFIEFDHLLWDRQIEVDSKAGKFDKLAAEALQGFDAAAWVQEMAGPLPSDGRLALGQIESTTYLRNQLLRDSDWASMDHSVELRTPLVDAWLLQDLQPLLGSFRRFPNKRLLAEAPDRPLPEALITRRKTGFGIPIAKWLRQMGRAGYEGDTSRAWARELAGIYPGSSH